MSRIRPLDAGRRQAREGGGGTTPQAGKADRHAGTCRWGMPTLFLPAPYWWDAEDRPWACVRDGTPRVLETTEACADCPYWEPRERGESTAPVTMVAALREALDDTHRARATYRKVIDTFGPVQPFVNMARAEERHARAFRSLFERLDVDPPRDTWPARVPSPTTLVEACAEAARAELERGAMYERLIPWVRDPAARRVMRRIQKASQERELPAFRRCFARALKPAGRPRGVRPGRSAPPRPTAPRGRQAR